MDLENIRGYYKDKIKAHGTGAEGMDWKNKDTQYLRFEMLAKYIDFKNNPSILDVGCGSSEFLNFCELNQLSCKYQGVDVVEEMVNESNTRFGDGTAMLGDLNSFDEDEQFDYAIVSGTFNLKLQQSEEAWKDFFYGNLIKMFKLSKKGIVFNCMTEHVDWTYDRLFYPKLSDLTSFIVKNLSRDFIVDHSYDLYEMTVYVSK